MVYGLDQGAVAGAVAEADAPRLVVRTLAVRLAPPQAPASASGVVSSRAAASAGRSGLRESLSQEVDRLARSADPVDAFAAYRLVTGCVWARDHEGWMARHILPADRALLPTPQQACGDIASDQVQSRLRWLERAALAGVHHAAIEMLREGPDGLGSGAGADIDAPRNAAWKQRIEAAIDAGVRTCDADALEHRVDHDDSGQGVAPDRARALVYRVASTECRRQQAGPPADLPADVDGITRRMGDTLTADQIARAVAEGQQLARDARPLPGDS